MPDPVKPQTNMQNEMGSAGNTNPVITNVPPVVVEETPPPPVPQPADTNVSSSMPATTTPQTAEGQGEQEKKKERKGLFGRKKKQETQIVAPGGKPKKKKGRMIATILGILVLVGGTVTSAYLVQQNQNILEKAYMEGGPCQVCTASGCKRMASPPDCLNSLNECSNNAQCQTGEKEKIDVKKVAQEYEDNKKKEKEKKEEVKTGTYECTKPGGECGEGGCKADEKCVETSHLLGIAKCQPSAECTTFAPTSGEYECTKPGGECGEGGCKADEKCVETSHLLGIAKCQPSTECPLTPIGSTGSTTNECPSGWDYLGDEVPIAQAQRICRSNCGGPVDLTAGCDPYGTVRKIDVNGRARYCYKCSSGTSSSGGKTTATTTTSGGNGGTTLTSQCLEVKALDINNNSLSNEDLSSLKAGDKIKLAIRGSTSSGSFPKARFIINGTTRPEVTTTETINSISYFIDTYTIPDGVSSFTIKGQLYHASIGWF